MATEEIGEKAEIRASEHFEPNLPNILLIMLIVVLTVYGLRAASRRWPSVFGGFAAI